MILVALTLFIWGIQTASAQTWGIKTNALYDATRTVNIGTEFALGKKWTLDISGNYNGWNAGSRCEKMKHFMVQPELRYWTCDVFNGHFFALHAMGGGYNISNVRFPFFTRKFDDGNRYEGWFVGQVSATATPGCSANAGTSKPKSERAMPIPPTTATNVWSAGGASIPVRGTTGASPRLPSH